MVTMAVGLPVLQNGGRLCIWCGASIYQNLKQQGDKRHAIASSSSYSPSLNLLNDTLQRKSGQNHNDTWLIMAVPQSLVHLPLNGSLLFALTQFSLRTTF